MHRVSAASLVYLVKATKTHHVFTSVCTVALPPKFYISHRVIRFCQMMRLVVRVWQSKTFVVQSIRCPHISWNRARKIRSSNVFKPLETTLVWSVMDQFSCQKPINGWVLGIVDSFILKTELTWLFASLCLSYFFVFLAKLSVIWLLNTRESGLCRGKFFTAMVCSRKFGHLRGLLHERVIAWWCRLTALSFFRLKIASLSALFVRCCCRACIERKFMRCHFLRVRLHLCSWLLVAHQLVETLHLMVSVLNERTIGAGTDHRASHKFWKLYIKWLLDVVPVPLFSWAVNWCMPLCINRAVTSIVGANWRNTCLDLLFCLLVTFSCDTLKRLWTADYLWALWNIRFHRGCGRCTSCF